MSGAVATICQTTTAVPGHILTQEDVKAAVRKVVPVEELHRRRDMTETMAIYRDHAIRLGRQVAAQCLQRAELPPEAVDMVITTSCTGVMIPSP